MADGKRAANARELFLGKDIGDQAHGLVDVQRHAVRGDDAGGFLAAMLQGMKAEVGERLRFRMVIDCDHAAFVTKFVVFSHQLSAVRPQ